MEIVTTTSTLALILSIFSSIGFHVTYIMPEGVKPYMWQPPVSAINKALNAFLYVQTGHWNFEVEIAKKRLELGKPVLPEVTNVLDSAREVLSNGFAITYAGDELNPHGWWMYPPNAILLMHKTAEIICLKAPSYCSKAMQVVNEEEMKIMKVLNDCSKRLSGKRALAAFPGEVYVAQGLGLKVVGVIAKTISVSPVQVIKALKEYKYDYIVMSDVSASTPVGKLIYRFAKGKNVVIIPLVEAEGKDYADYLARVCGEFK